jgi:hypothetical protein
MKKNITILLFILIGVMTIFFVLAQKKKGIDTIPENLIKESIQTFTKLVDSLDIQEFGLKSVDELKSLIPGKQFKNYLIAVDDIKKYKAGEDVRKIINEYPSIEVSLVNGTGNIITSIEFVKNKDKWEAAGYGSTPEFIILRNAQAAIGDSAIKKGTLIRIPALHTSFIAVPSATDLNFIILDDNFSLDFKKGAILPASQAILKLVPLANKHNGLPN